MIAENVPAFDANVDSSSTRQVFYAQYQAVC
ncbi:hypothetical protein Lxx03350 [Leifsonia xyli subsp. xyli str. CTCB07]|uniref:Uncharacterized protein n=1 Tax=Leifsonia xyli subsp. xyli (strain CTCB07) TaxID=281090 RepID=Q6AGZ3_LEIXX|nr:hypothetical protein Lxx03350 [Leifsonia xyli subsp. xyli str. CTCB07]